MTAVPCSIQTGVGSAVPAKPRACRRHPVGTLSQENSCRTLPNEMWSQGIFSWLSRQGRGETTHPNRRQLRRTGDEPTATPFFFAARFISPCVASKHTPHLKYSSRSPLGFRSPGSVHLSQRRCSCCAWRIGLWRRSVSRGECLAASLMPVDRPTQVATKRWLRSVECDKDCSQLELKLSNGSCLSARVTFRWVVSSVGL